MYFTSFWRLFAMFLIKYLTENLTLCGLKACMLIEQGNSIICVKIFVLNENKKNFFKSMFFYLLLNLQQKLYKY